MAPIGVGAFFSARGWVVFSSELVWVWLPSAGLLVLGAFRRWIARPAVNDR